jgi:hypothetical protein
MINTNLFNYFLAAIFSFLSIIFTTFTEGRSHNNFFNSELFYNSNFFGGEQIKNLINYLYDLLFFVSSLHVVNVLIILLPALLSVAFMTIIERKQLAAHQRRVGPNTVGYYGVLQPFADALKLILKENVIPAQSNKLIFYLAPVASLFFSLLG